MAEPKSLATKKFQICTFMEQELLDYQKSAYKKITPLAEEIKHCTNIELRLEKIKPFEFHQKLEEERKQAEKSKKDKERIR